MEYKKSFAAITSYAIQRDLMDSSVEEVINAMKAEYSTEDFEEAAEKHLLTLCPIKPDEFGKYSKLIDDVLVDIYNQGWYYQVW